MRRIVREISLFVFSVGLIIYLLIYCFFSFLIDFFKETKIAKFIFLIQEGIDWLIQNVGVFIKEKLEKRNMWY